MRKKLICNSLLWRFYRLCKPFQVIIWSQKRCLFLSKKFRLIKLNKFLKFCHRSIVLYLLQMFYRQMTKVFGSIVICVPFRRLWLLKLCKYWHDLFTRLQSDRDDPFFGANVGLWRWSDVGLWRWSDFGLWRWSDVGLWRFGLRSLSGRWAVHRPIQNLLVTVVRKLRSNRNIDFSLWKQFTIY